MNANNKGLNFRGRYKTLPERSGIIPDAVSDCDDTAMEIYHTEQKLIELQKELAGKKEKLRAFLLFYWTKEEIEEAGF